MKIALCLQSHSAVLFRGLCAICLLKNLPPSVILLDVQHVFVYMKLAVLFIIIVLQTHGGGLSLPPTEPDPVDVLRN